MWHRNVHVYIATAQHGGIRAEARHHSATEAFRALIEKFHTNRKGSEEITAKVKSLASRVMLERRGQRDWSGTKVSEGRTFAKLERI